MTRIPIRLRNESVNALRTLARQEYRDIRQQAAWIIEHELERRGLLTIEPRADPAQALPIQSAGQLTNQEGINANQ
ncbi:MAG: hypothetical protein Fur002_08370 [Anaerolineales bacterium]